MPAGPTTPSATESPLSILAASPTAPVSDSDTTWWLERKARRRGQTVKISAPLEAMEVQYERTGFQLGETRVTLDRDVRDHRGVLDQVVIEVKGPMPKWLRKLLPPEDKQFSKSRWAARPA